MAGHVDVIDPWLVGDSNATGNCVVIVTPQSLGSSDCYIFGMHFLIFDLPW